MTEHAATRSALPGRVLGIVGGLLSAAQAIALAALFGPEAAVVVDLAKEAWSHLGRWTGEANACGLLMFVVMALALLVVVVLLALVAALYVLLLGATYGAFVGRPRWLVGATVANVIACGAWLCVAALVPDHAVPMLAHAGAGLLAAVLCGVAAMKMRRAASAG